MTKASGVVGDAVEALTALGYSQTMAYQQLNPSKMLTEWMLRKF